MEANKIMQMLEDTAYYRVSGTEGELKAAEYLKEKSVKTAAILMSGDCGFYSGAEKLITALSDYETEVISGISAPVYFCSKISL